MITLKKNGKDFITDFFSPLNNREEIVTFFQNAFISNENIISEVSECIKNTLSKKSEKKNVIIIEGHPRIGKTWITAAAIAKLADELNLTGDNIFNTGVDSLKLGNYQDNLEKITISLQNKIKKIDKNITKIFFLDDFWGTYKLREPNNDCLSFCKSYFDFNKNEGFLKEIPLGSVLIMTGRSYFYFLIEILLNINLHSKLESNCLNIFQLGIFRNKEGKINGTYTKDIISEIYKTNLLHHPLKDAKYHFIQSSPIIAFAENNSLDEKQREIASRALFGDDIDLLLNQCKKYKESSNIFYKLASAYIFSIGPGILFLGKNCFDQLGLKADIKLLAKSLYYSESDFQTGKLPNEFYMNAVDIHIKSYCSDVLGVIKRYFLENGNSSLNGRTLGIILRGLIERQLINGDIRILCESDDFKKILSKYKELTNFNEEGDNFLFKIELHHHCNYNLDDLGFNFSINCLKPGLAAAIGWILQLPKFLSHDEHGSIIKDYTLNWFKNSIIYFCKKCNEGNNENNLFDSLASFYSTFLQWGLQNQNSDYANEILEFISPPNLTDQEKTLSIIQLIHDDELVWSFFPNESFDINSRPAIVADRFPSIVDLRSFIISKKEMVSIKEMKRGVNLFFTLIWHNAWMSLTDCKDNQILNGVKIWFNNNSEKFINYIKLNPDSLDTNLQYHWCHFITQYSTWMRDWCFQDDPNKFIDQLSKISKGSNVQKDNDMLTLVFNDLINSTKNTSVSLNSLNRIRNIFMFIGTRSSRLNFNILMKSISDLIKSNIKYLNSILIAIFELARQEYLETDNKNTSKNFREWCKMNIFENYEKLVVIAWEEYWIEINRVSHSLDLIPREKNGWEDVLPEDWIIELQKEKDNGGKNEIY